MPGTPKGEIFVSSLDAFAVERLHELEAATLRRRVVVSRRKVDGSVEREGRTLLSFCCNDYLGLSQHPTVIEAARRALEEYGAGAGAAPLVTGTHPLYRDLEEKLAAFKGTEAAAVFGSGYLANIGIIPALMGAGDLILADELSHICLLSGTWLSRSDFVRFRHNDIDQVRTVLAERRGEHDHCLIVTESVFSMDGDEAPLEDLSRMAAEHDAWLMVDDAHGLGVINGGKGGGYRPDGSAIPIDLRMGTLSKAIGGYGGYVCASAPVIDFIRNRARSFIYTTCLPPSVIAGDIAALEIIATDKALCARPMMLAKLFTDALGLPGPQSCIVPVIIGDEARALAAAESLAEQGFQITAMRPPTVPEGTSRLRITFTAMHREDDVLRLADAVKGLGVVNP
jgi:8-amino-7-oxononanoate synthase